MFIKLFELLTSNRFKSFYWRTGMMAVAGFLALLADNIGVLEFSGEITAVVGLVLGEISKSIHNKYQRK